MKINNKLNLPQPFVDAVTKEYEYKEKQYRRKQWNKL